MEANDNISATSLIVLSMAKAKPRNILSLIQFIRTSKCLMKKVKFSFAYAKRA
jgi:hypothetical protein